MLEAHERHAPAVDDQFTGVGRADADHEHDIIADVDIEQSADLFFRQTRQRHHIGSRQEREQVIAIRIDRGLYDLFEVRPRRLEDIIVPVGRQ